MNSAGLFRKLARSGLQNLAPYKTGKPMEELEREVGRGDLVKLASNENPLGLLTEFWLQFRESIEI